MRVRLSFDLCGGGDRSIDWARPSVAISIIELGSSCAMTRLGVPLRSLDGGEDTVPPNFAGDPPSDFRGEPIEVLMGERDRGGKDRCAPSTGAGSGRESRQSSKP